jgi:hypothetical protein
MYSDCCTVAMYVRISVDEMEDSESREPGNRTNLLLFLKDGKQAQKMGDVAFWLITA